MNQQSAPTSIIIRPAAPGDAQAIAELHVRSWQWAYRDLLPPDYLQSLSSTMQRRSEAHYAAIVHPRPQERRWVAQRDGQIAGFAVTNVSRDPDATPGTAEIEAIYLAPQSVGKGIGRVLFTHIVEDLRQRHFKQATLWVMKSNTRARKFYESAGWLPDGQSKVEERPEASLHEVRYHIMF